MDVATIGICKPCVVLGAGLALAVMVLASVGEAEIPWKCVANCGSPRQQVPVPLPSSDPEAFRRVAGQQAKEKGLAAYEAGDWDTAVQHLGEALKYLPGDPEVFSHLREAERQATLSKLRETAQSALAQNDWDGAIAALERAARLSPNDAVLQRELVSARALRANDEGLRYLQAGDFNHALSAFAEALKHRPNDPTITKNRERALEQMRYASWKAEDERLARERAAKEAAQKATQETVRVILDARAGQGSGGLQVSLDSIAARQAELAKRTRGLSRIPWDSPGQLEGGVVDARRGGAGGKQDRATPPPRSLPPAAKAVQQRIDALARQSAVLDGQVREEKDPVKRAELINKQTAIRSQQRVEEIALVDILVRAPATAGTK